MQAERFFATSEIESSLAAHDCLDHVRREAPHVIFPLFDDELFAVIASRL
jgi:hypothetical protein